MAAEVVLALARVPVAPVPVPVVEDNQYPKDYRYEAYRDVQA